MYKDLWMIIKDKNGQYYRYPRRYADNIPNGYEEVKDGIFEDGDISPKYWALKRVNVKGKIEG